MRISGIRLKKIGIKMTEIEKADKFYEMLEILQNEFWKRDKEQAVDEERSS